MQKIAGLKSNTKLSYLLDQYNQEFDAKDNY